MEIKISNAPTKILIDLHAIIMFEIGGDGLLAVKDASISKRRSKGIGLREAALAALQVFKPHPFHICGKMRKLAKASMSMSMERADK